MSEFNSISSSQLKRKRDETDDDCRIISKLDISSQNVNSAFKDLGPEASKGFAKTAPGTSTAVVIRPQHHQPIGIRNSHNGEKSDLQKQAESAWRQVLINFPTNRTTSRNAIALVPVTQEVVKKQYSQSSIEATSHGRIHAMTVVDKASKPADKQVWNMFPTGKDHGTNNIGTLDHSAAPRKSGMMNRKREDEPSIVLSDINWAVKSVGGTETCVNTDRKKVGRHRHPSSNCGTEKKHFIPVNFLAPNLPPSPVLSLTDVAPGEASAASDSNKESTTQPDSNAESRLRNTSIPDLLSHIDNTYMGNDSNSDIVIKNVRSVQDTTAVSSGTKYNKLKPRSKSSGIMRWITSSSKETVMSNKIKGMVSVERIHQLHKVSKHKTSGYSSSTWGHKFKPFSGGMKAKQLQNKESWHKNKRLRIKLQPRGERRFQIATLTIGDDGKAKANCVSSVDSSSGVGEISALSRRFSDGNVRDMDAWDDSRNDISVVSVWSESSTNENALSDLKDIDQEVTHDTYPQKSIARCHEPRMWPQDNRLISSMQRSSSDVLGHSSISVDPEHHPFEEGQTMKKMVESLGMKKPLVMLSDIFDKLTPAQLKQLGPPMKDSAARQFDQQNIFQGDLPLQQTKTPVKDSGKIDSCNSASYSPGSNKSLQVKLSMGSLESEVPTKESETKVSRMSTRQSLSIELPNALTETEASAMELSKASSRKPVQSSSVNISPFVELGVQRLKPGMVMKDSGEASANDSILRHSQQTSTSETKSPPPLRHLRTPAQDHDYACTHKPGIESSRQGWAGMHIELQSETPKKDFTKAATNESTLHSSPHSRSPLVKLKRLPPLNTSDIFRNAVRTRCSSSEQESVVAVLPGSKSLPKGTGTIAKTAGRRRIQLKNGNRKGDVSSARRQYRHIRLKKLNDYYEIVIAIKSLKRKRHERKLPGEYNFLCAEALKELISVLLLCKKSRKCKTVLLSSVGPVFCSGLDPLSLLGWSASAEPSQNIMSLTQDLTNILIDYEKPVMAVVQGPAVGFGASLLLFCDAIYASERATIQWPAAHMGTSVCGCASFLLPKFTGPIKARSLLIGGSIMTAKEAKASGIITEIFPHDSYMHHGIAMCRRMCSASSVSTSHLKNLLVADDRKNLRSCNSREVDVLKHCIQSRKCMEHLEIYILTQLMTS